MRSMPRKLRIKHPGAVSHPPSSGSGAASPPLSQFGATSPRLADSGAQSLGGRGERREEMLHERDRQDFVVSVAKVCQESRWLVHNGCQSDGDRRERSVFPREREACRGLTSLCGLALLAVVCFGPAIGCGRPTAPPRSAGDVWNSPDSTLQQRLKAARALVARGEAIAEVQKALGSNGVLTRFNRPFVYLDGTNSTGWMDCTRLDYQFPDGFISLGFARTNRTGEIRFGDLAQPWEYTELICLGASEGHWLVITPTARPAIRSDNNPGAFLLSKPAELGISH
jgi:hypothetical protein